MISTIPQVVARYVFRKTLMSCVLAVGITVSIANAQTAYSCGASVMPMVSAGFVSGTYCEAEVYFHTISIPADPLGSYTVKVTSGASTTTLGTYTVSANVGTASATVYFDSTHFADGSTVSITVEGKDTNGLLVASATSTAAPVINRVSAMGRSEWEVGTKAGQGVVHAASLTAINHSAHSITAAGWNHGDVVTELNWCTVFYVNSHGFWHDPAKGTCFQTDHDEVALGSPEYVYPTVNDTYINGSPQWGQTPQVWEVRKNLCGVSGLPPLFPEMNFAFLDACDTGKGLEFATAILYPDYNGMYTPKAELGWLFQTAINATYQDGQALWGKFKNGYTASDARHEMVNAYNTSQGTSYTDTTATALRGDQNLRLHMLWTNSGGQGTTWNVVYNTEGP